MDLKVSGLKGSILSPIRRKIIQSFASKLMDGAGGRVPTGTMMLVLPHRYAVNAHFASKLIDGAGGWVPTGTMMLVFSVAAIVLSVANPRLKVNDEKIYKFLSACWCCKLLDKTSKLSLCFGDTHKNRHKFTQKDNVRSSSSTSNIPTSDIWVLLS